jgi:hypothetical protein
MQPNKNLVVSTLYEQTKGERRWLCGRWGKLRVFVFPAEPTADGTRTYRLELQEAGEYQPRQEGHQKAQERGSTKAERELTDLLYKPL